jgi:hypothetical protein
MGNNRNWLAPCSARAGILLESLLKRKTFKHSKNPPGTQMKTFSNMSTPDLYLTQESYELNKQVSFKRLTELDENGGLESDLQELSEKIERVNELMTAVEQEIYNRKQDE